MTSGIGHGWYPGDIVEDLAGNRGVLRAREGERAKVQFGADRVWTWLADLRWTGEVIADQLPRTEHGWRKLGAHVAVNGEAG